MTAHKVITSAVERNNWSTTVERGSEHRETYATRDGGKHIVQVKFSQRGSVVWATLDGRAVADKYKASQVTNFLEKPYDVAATRRLAAAAKDAPFTPRDTLGKLGRKTAASLFKTYDLGVTLVDRLDNGGEPCEHCQLIGHVIQVQAYGRKLSDFNVFGEPLEVESCMACLPAALVHAEIDATQLLRLEIARGVDE